SELFSDAVAKRVCRYLACHVICYTAQPIGSVSAIDDSAARHELMPLVYDELRRLARRRLRGERHNTTLQPTALVHDVFLRLVKQDKVSFQNRAQFFGLCATIWDLGTLAHFFVYNSVSVATRQVGFQCGAV